MGDRGRLLRLALLGALQGCGPGEPAGPGPLAPALDAGPRILVGDAAAVFGATPTAIAAAPPELLWYAASPARLGPEGGAVHLRFGTRDATALRLVRLQDRRELCRWPGSCELVGDLRSGSLQVEPPYQVTTYLLELEGPGGHTGGAVDVLLEPPRFPATPYNDISLWLLAHRPLQAPFSFVALGDSQPDSASCPVTEQLAFAELRQQILQLEPRPDLVVALGDVVALGTPCEWLPYVTEALHPFVDELGIPWLTVIGNHEQYDSHGLANFEHFAGATDLAFDVASARFVVLNAFHRDEPGELFLYPWQLELLTDQLAGASVDGTRDVFLLMHHPPSLPPDPGGCQHRLYAPFAGAFFDALDGYRKAEAVVTLLERYAPPVSLALYGHVHAFGHYPRGGVHHVVTGGGGGPLCQAGELDLRDDPAAEPPYADGIFHHLVHVLVRSDRGQDLEVRVHRRGEAAAMQGYSFVLP